MKPRARIMDRLELLRLSTRLQLGRRAWLVPALALIWPAYRAASLLFGWRQQSFTEDDVQNGLIGVPIYLLAVGLGVRIIASEIEQRTLEVTYTVPGGAKRVWMAKLVGALLPLAVAGLLIAVLTAVFLAACADPVSPGPVRAGTWGGNNAGAVVSDSGAHIHIGCTAGQSELLVADSSGHFTDRKSVV